MASNPVKVIKLLVRATFTGHIWKRIWVGASPSLARSFVISSLSEIKIMDKQKENAAIKFFRKHPILSSNIIGIILGIAIAWWLWLIACVLGFVFYFHYQKTLKHEVATNKAASNDAVKTKKCRACKMDIAAGATKCPHCRTAQPNSVAAVFGLFGIIVAVVAIVVISSNSDTSTPTKQSKLNDPTIDWQSICSAFDNLKTANIVKKVEGRSVYVAPFWWNVANIEDKKNIGFGSAYCIARDLNSTTVWSDIYDWQSGKKLAHYSEAWGFSVE